MTILIVYLSLNPHKRPVFWAIIVMWGKKRNKREAFCTAFLFLY